MHRIPSELRG